MSVLDVLRGHLEVAMFAPDPADASRRSEVLLSELSRLDLPLDPAHREGAFTAARYHFVALSLSSHPLEQRARALLADLVSSRFLAA